MPITKKRFGKMAVNNVDITIVLGITLDENSNWNSHLVK